MLDASPRRRMRSSASAMVSSGCSTSSGGRASGRIGSCNCAADRGATDGMANSDRKKSGARSSSLTPGCRYAEKSVTPWFLNTSSSRKKRPVTFRLGCVRIQWAASAMMRGLRAFCRASCPAINRIASVSIVVRGHSALTATPLRAEFLRHAQHTERHPVFRHRVGHVRREPARADRRMQRRRDVEHVRVRRISAGAAAPSACTGTCRAR